MTDPTLRELCAAYIDSCETYMRTHDAMDRYAATEAGLQLGSVLGVPDAVPSLAYARAILAALNAERAAGRKEAFRAARGDWDPVSPERAESEDR